MRIWVVQINLLWVLMNEFNKIVYNPFLPKCLYRIIIIVTIKMGLVCWAFKEESSITSRNNREYFEKFRITSRTYSESEIKAHLSRKMYMKRSMDTVSEKNYESSSTILNKTRGGSVFSITGQNLDDSISKNYEIKEENTCDK